MRLRLFIAAIFILCSPGIFAETNACNDNANSQLELNFCAASEFERADNELNAVYKEILSRYQNSPAFLKNLKTAQRAWLAFRDAEMKMIYPLSVENYGSSHPMCYAATEAAITMERVKTLRKWLGPFKEGDICEGSVGSFDEPERK